MPAHFTPDLHLYFDIPEPIFRARINQPGTITYPATALTFDTVTLGAFGDIQPDMTLILGSTLGADDLGRVRVQKPATSSTIPIGRVSQGTEDGTLNIADNVFVEVWEDYRVWAKIPFDNTDTGIDYKDSDEPVGDFNVELPPVSNCGPGAVDYVDSITGLLTVQLPMGGVNESYAMADGATIVTYAWDLKGGTATVGTVASAVLTATFPAGKYWVALTVTDSNGKQHTSRCVVLAIDPDDDPTAVFIVPSHRITASGQTIAFGMLDSIPRTTYPDGGLVIFFDGSMLNPGDRSNLKFYGWHQSDSFSIRATPTGLIRDTVLNCVDVAGRLAALPGFPQALQREAEDDVDIMWSLMPGLDMRKCLWYLAFWHSTALSLADFFLPDELSDYPSMRLDSTGASLYEQINSRAQSCVPDHWLTCNTLGQLSVLPDWMLLDFADRPVATAGTFTEDFWSDIRVDYTRPPRVYVLNSSAVVCSTTWLELGGEDTLPLAFCKAPGFAFGQGVSEATTGEKLTISQEQLNHCEGHRHARLNARYGLFAIVEPSGDIQAFEPAAMLPVQLNISAEKAAQRGLDFTTARGLVKSIDMRYNHTEHGTWVSPTIQWEREVIGLPAVTHIPEESEPVDDIEVPEPPPTTVPPDFGLIGGQEMVAGIGSDGYVYRTSDFQTVSGSGGPTWDRVDTTIADTIYSFVVDPFSPAYIDGSGAVNGWIANDTDIYRVADLFGTPVATSVYTFDEPTVAADFHWRSIQASFGAYFAEGVNPWLLCISYYGDTAGHTGTWATRSTDGGVTWSAEVQISALYAAAVPTRFNPIGVFTSPRTPGYALTAAHVEAENPAEPLPHWGLWDEDLGVLVSTSVGGVFDMDIRAESLAGEGLVETPEWRILLAPPANAVRVLLECSYYHDRTESGASGGFSHGVGYTVGRLPIANLTETEDLTFTPGVTNGAPSAQSYTVEWTRTSGTDWPGNRDELPTVTDFDDFARWRMYVSAATSGTKNAVAVLRHTATIVEIELEGGYIYQPAPSLVVGGGFAAVDWGATWVQSALIEPGQAQAGSIHVPWEDNAAESLIYFGAKNPTANREFRLMQSSAGVITDISPDDTGVFFGVNHYGFAVRAFDNDRQFLAVSGIGNDTSNDPADDLVGLWVSANAGTAWTNILAPVAASEAHIGLQIAFGGDNSDVLFAWGGWSNGSLPAIWYSDDFGTLDSREGNINSLGTVALIGIAGGPTP